MCGIFCSISPSDYCIDNVAGFEETLKLLARRGPDRSSQHQCHVNTSATDRPPQQCLRFCGQVLWQQGRQACAQPIVRRCAVAGSRVLLLNGDVYTARTNGAHQSDTEWLMERLEECQTEEHLLTLFQTVIRGPFSFIYFDEAKSSLYFGRDSLGRHSLLIGQTENDELPPGSTIITSVASKRFMTTTNLMELPALGLFKISLDLNAWSLFPWQELETSDLYREQLVELGAKLNVKVNVLTIPIQPKWLQSPAPASSSTVPPLRWSLEDSCCSEDELPDSTVIFERCLAHPDIHIASDTLLSLLEQSVRDRCAATPPRCRDCIPIAASSAPRCQHSRVAVLFSGGLDCTILALLADRFVPAECPIDLLNVSFEKVRRSSASSQLLPVNYDTPDRISARGSLHELRTLRPQRRWQLVEANVSRAELNAELRAHIAHLVHPLDTVLDESLGAALWFAARGRGHISGTTVIAAEAATTAALYTSPARVLLHGSGADELFGGYTRHRNAYTRAVAAGADGWAALRAELDCDWTRLPARNLARDDRVCADHGRTARAPYVEESVVAFVRALDARQRCVPALPAGCGDKLLLRLVAFALGLSGAAGLRKRALQFGSRVADSRQNAADRSGTLVNGGGE